MPGHCPGPSLQAGVSYSGKFNARQRCIFHSMMAAKSTGSYHRGPQGAAAERRQRDAIANRVGADKGLKQIGSPVRTGAFAPQLAGKRDS
jgi:hypothetical protein